MAKPRKSIELNRDFWPPARDVNGLRPDAKASRPGVARCAPRDETARTKRGMAVADPLSMNIEHVAVWIDHAEAKIFHVDAESFDTTTIHAPHRQMRRHPPGPADREREHPADDKHFFHEVARALEGAQEILVVGPASAKLEFVKHVHAHDRALGPKIVGVETADHPTDGQFAAHVRRYFRDADRMRGTAI